MTQNIRPLHPVVEEALLFCSQEAFNEDVVMWVIEQLHRELKHARWHMSDRELVLMLRTRYRREVAEVVSREKRFADEHVTELRKVGL